MLLRAGCALVKTFCTSCTWHVDPFPDSIKTRVRSSFTCVAALLDQYDSAVDVGQCLQSMQASAGKLLRVFTNWSIGRITYVTQLQLTMAVVMVFGCVVLALHGYIAAVFPSNAAQINPKVIAKAQRLAQRRDREHGSRSSTGGFHGQPSARGHGCHHLLRARASPGLNLCRIVAGLIVIRCSGQVCHGLGAAELGSSALQSPLSRHTKLISRRRLQERRRWLRIPQQSRLGGRVAVGQL